jgi:hypothetical protein
MKRALVCLAVLVLSLLAARVAFADAHFTDPAGDSGGAPDITAVNAVNDASGNLTFTVTTNQPTVAADALLVIAFNTDKNNATGDSDGDEFVLFADSTGWELDRWDGSKYVAATAPSANSTYSSGVLTLKVNKADLANVNTFFFYAASLQFDAADKVIARDDAPNGTAVYDYTLSTPPPATPLTLRASAPVPVPLRPVHGKAFAVRVAVTRGDTGGPLASGTVTCKVTVGLKALRSAGAVRAGRAACNMVVPANAKGKRLRGTIKVTFRNVSVTKSFSYLIR